MTVLAAVDGETIPSKSVSVAHDLAQDLDEELVVLHVLPQEVFEGFQGQRAEGNTIPALSLAPGISYRDADRSHDSMAGSGSSEQYTIEDGQRNAERVARDVVEHSLEHQTNVTCRGRVGEPVQEILNEAERSDARYLVIGGRKRTPIGKAVFGSITQSVLLNATVPVLTVMQDDE
jgi:nucleotide-binding universal stress UspA family protein